VLVRSWNLFHGNAVPPQRREFLEQMIALATADEPDVLCVQEVPAWALPGFTAGDVAARARVGPLPISPGLGRRLTDLNHGLLRSAFSGQGNGILVRPRLRVLSHHVLTLNPRRFRDARARKLRLRPAARLAWAKERRIVQALRLDDGNRTFMVANLHCTSYAPDRRLADAELERAAWFAVSEAQPEDVVVLAGDLNVTTASSATLRGLDGPDWGFSAPAPGIDQILVRGATPTPLRRWPDDRRRLDGQLLSDHAPVELEL
jgi:endonuclease/exonuclease/phosphatase family metal-dependent hydrolase